MTDGESGVPFEYQRDSEKISTFLVTNFGARRFTVNAFYDRRPSSVRWARSYMIASVSKTKPTDGEQQKLVLLVDDNHVHRYALCKHLEGSDLAVIEAATADEALKVTLERLPDVVFMDIHLPDGDGFAVCVKIKSNPKTSKIPVVFHSATADTLEARTEAESVGGAAFVRYPIDVEHLVFVLLGSIARATQEAEAVDGGRSS